MTQGEIAYLVTAGGIVLFASLIALYDLLAQRQQRRQRQRRDAA